MKVDFGAEDATEEPEEEEEEVKQAVFKLAEEDVEFIYDNTHYTLKDIKDWHRSAAEILLSQSVHQGYLISSNIFSRGFAKDCPNGKLYRHKVTEVYETIVPNGNCKFFVDHIFRIFDQDGNGE